MRAVRIDSRLLPSEQKRTRKVQRSLLYAHHTRSLGDWTLDDFLLKILVCPVSQQSLSKAPTKLVKAINASIKKGSLHDHSGETVETPVDGLLVRDDGLVAYPVRNEIPEMLAQRGIHIEKNKISVEKQDEV